MTSPSSSPSEGEIVESDTEKATTALASSEDISVDRQIRTITSVSRSPSRSMSPRRRASRTASRSPYRQSRGAKRSLDDDHYDRARNDPRRFKVRYEDHYIGDRSRARDPMYGVKNYADRSVNHGERHANGHIRDHRHKTRSRSPPYAHGHKLDHKGYMSKVAGSRVDKGTRDERGDRGYKESRSKLSTEQSVSDRGHSSVAAARIKHKAESQKHQKQQAGKLQRDSDHSSASSGRQAASGSHDVAQAPEAQPIDEVILIEERRKKREAIKAKYRGQATPLLVQALAIDSNSAPSTPKSTTKDEESRELALGSPQSDISPIGLKNAIGRESPTNFTILNDAELANEKMTSSQPNQEDEPSAADYDPTMDMQEDKVRQDQHQRKDEVSSAAYDETATIDQDILLPESVNEPNRKNVEDGFDMFADTDDFDMFAEGAAVLQKPEKEASKAVAVPQPKAADTEMLDDWDDPEGYYKVILGELLDRRYQVQSNLGKGMFSSVVRAVDQETSRLVAIKLIRNNETMMKAGLKEIDILEKLSAADPDDKKHLIRLERYFGHKGHLCMVFENLSINLREVLKKFGRDVGINLKAVRAYAQQMFLGLSLLRKCNILHADLKPDNILVNESRNLLKICDLGSASDASENEITQYLVSRFYRAPEVILGMQYDFGIDMWSVGCTLFELYTGKILFTGRSNNQMLRAIMECRGKFSHKVLRKAEFAPLHFDDLLNFRSVEKDKLTGKDVVRVLNFTKPTRDLRSRLIANVKSMEDAEVKEVNLFIDLLDRCLHLNLEKRCTPTEALRHPFIMRMKT